MIEKSFNQYINKIPDTMNPSTNSLKGFTNELDQLSYSENNVWGSCLYFF